MFFKRLNYLKTFLMFTGSNEAKVSEDHFFVCFFCKWTFMKISIV